MAEVSKIGMPSFASSINAVNYEKRAAFRNRIHYVKLENYHHNVFTITRKAKAASGRLSFEQGYNQTCQGSQNLRADLPKLHAKFHQNRCTSFGEKCEQENDIV